MVDSLGIFDVSSRGIFQNSCGFNMQLNLNW